MIDAAALLEIHSAVSGMLKSPDTHCQACGRIVGTGHTCFHITTQQCVIFLTCWECGEAIMQHQGFAIAAEFPTCPPYGGGNRETAH